MRSDAVLLFCHGARAPSWREPFDVMRDECQDKLGLKQERVALAFLEFMQPDFASAAEELYVNGARRISVVLLFLATGGHTLSDVSALVAKAKEKHPDLHLDVSDTLLSNTSIRGAIVNELVASYSNTYSPK